jgi:hypothetical protein
LRTWLGICHAKRREEVMGGGEGGETRRQPIAHKTQEDAVAKDSLMFPNSISREQEDYIT